MRRALFVLGVLLLSASAEARCRITNDTSHNFTVASGETWGQYLGAYSTTTIDGGDMSGQSDDGREFSGLCRDGDAVTVKEIQGRIRVMRQERW